MIAKLNRVLIALRVDPTAAISVQRVDFITQFRNSAKIVMVLKMLILA